MGVNQLDFLDNVSVDDQRAEFLKRVKLAWDKNEKNFGFIPFPRLIRDYDYNRFVADENGFVLIGSLFAKVTPIHAVYIYPERRDGSTDKVIALLSKLPRKKYRVRCHSGKLFWLRRGLKEIRTEKKNTRKRDIFVLEGFLGLENHDQSTHFA